MQARARTSAAGLAEAMEAIGSPRRRHILRLVWEGERSAGEIAAASDVSWPAVSQNLRVLKDSGLISERRAGTRRYYPADGRPPGPLAAVLRRTGTAGPGGLEKPSEGGDRRLN